MIRAALVAAAALCAAPIQAQQAEGGDPYSQAVAARLRGDPAEAVRLLEPLVRSAPANADAQVQLGYAYLALDRLAEAEAAFESALGTSPDYSDARLGLARVAQRHGDRAGAMEHLRALAPGNAEAQALLRQIDGETGAAHWTLELGAGYAIVDGPQSDWKESAVELRRVFSDGAGLAGRVETSRRFGRTDVYLEARGDKAIGAGGHVYALLGHTPDADFRARWQAGLGGSFKLGPASTPTVVTLDLRHAQFPTGDVQTVTPGLEQYLAAGRAWITARWINTFDDSGRHLSGYLIRGDFQPREGLRAFIGYADAPDTSEGVLIDTRSYFGGVVADVSDRLTARLSAGFDDSETAADRTNLALSFGWRF